MKAEPFENVRNQIGFCGIWCGSCLVGNGTLREVTEKYEKIIKNYDLENWAPKNFDFSEFKKGLASIQAMPLCEGCLKGDGRSNCEMRICALGRNTTDCSECAQPSECENFETLQKMRTGASRAGLLVKAENIDRSELIEKWMTELKSRWPFCLLFLHDE